LIAATLVFLTPRGALLTLVGLVPLGALAVTSRRERRARTVLRLPTPSRGGLAGPALAVTAIAGLLGVAASQPVLRSTSSLNVRTDAEALFVIDISRSMLASRAPGARTRISRARDAAIRLREALAAVPAGVAVLTDHVLPDLLPVPDRAVFEQTVRRSARIDNPPPATDAVTATSLGALGALGTDSFFPPSAKHRVAIVLTDGESRPFDVRDTARALAHGPAVTPILIQVSSPDESVFGQDGRPETAYRTDPSSTELLANLAQAAHGGSFSEPDLGAAVRAIRAALGQGPTAREGLTVSTTALAPYFALAALLPLLLLLTEGRRRPLALLSARREPMSPQPRSGLMGEATL
jgi:hypothetical protein